VPAAPTYPASELFHLWRAGDQSALNRFLPLVYDELRRVARRHLRREREDHTLQTTALIHEAYLRLVRQQPAQVQDRCHFVALTSNLMRQILVDHARERLAKKRDGGCRITLSEDLAVSESSEVDVLAVDSALTRLSHLDPQQARVVELRYFGGLSIQETSDVLGISPATVKRDWATARAWLHREIQHSPASHA
jgi:RNA polymerase sigma factor (TIGR02999 family)